MKKYIPLVFAVLVHLINMTIFWYSDSLFDEIFIFSLAPICFALLLLIASLIISVIHIKRSPRECYRFISIIVGIITFAMIIVFPFRDVKVKFELWAYEKERAEVIDMVIDRTITPDEIGNADLPDGYKKTSSSGQIFIYQNDTEQVICFWVFRGMVDGSVRLIYSSEDEALIYENEKFIESISELEEHWYLVSTDQ